MDILFKALMLFATIDLAIFAIEEGRKIYRRYQAKKALEAFAAWAKKCMEERAQAQREDKKKEG
ncbi:MAG: hypothetical protein LKE88_05145 [Acidaminococcus provencensis]|jgi:hypothetical protein|uniref:hypothetical protein n=1 Tax=Acidaminococcus provencensis TaxID=2058289 RepID=UPI0023F2D606|nr:hypothetical protein [Acidaminococcus provencensis]MCH4096012.1 hypothetical protein [Acidaminococcus provencensis]